MFLIGQSYKPHPNPNGRPCTCAYLFQFHGTAFLTQLELSPKRLSMWCCMFHYVFIMSFDIYVNSRGTVTQHLSCMYYTCVYLCVSLLVALDCIGQVYQLDVTNQEHITTYSIDKSLEVSWNIACTCVCAGSNVYCYPQFHFCNLQCIYIIQVM